MSITISAWDTSLGSFSSKFWIDDITTLSQNFKIFRERFHKQIIQLKVPFTFDFHISINIDTWNTNLNLLNPYLDWWHHHGKLKIHCCLVAMYYFETVLKHLTFFLILVFWNKYCPLVPNFIMIDWKLGTIWRILYFYLMRNYTVNLLEFWRFVKDITNKIEKLA